MLNIPDEVKALFKADSIFKNFHVHFPNGENTDLNNDDIVSESVSFTESICSKDVFQFGLSERSQIQFECVGVQNIYGMTIECAIEIDVDSLGAAWISSHQPTGTEEWLDPQVCTYGARNMYRVPYGRFIVESCPRSQGAMKHRRVNGYSIDGYANAANITSSVLTLKESCEVNPTLLDSDDGKLLQNAFLLIAGETQNVDGLTLSETTLSMTTENDMQIQQYEWEYNGTHYFLELDGTSAHCNVAETNDVNSLYRATYSMNASALADVETIIEEVLAHGGDEKTARDFLKRQMLPFYTCKYNPGLYVYNVRDRAQLEMDSGYFYGYYPWDSTYGITAAVMFPANLNFSVFSTGTVYLQKTIQTCTDNQTVKRYEQTDANMNSFRIGLSATGTGTDKSTFIGSVDIYELARGLAEVTGQFFTVSRTGIGENVTVNKNNPIAMPPADYSEMWWDEYNVEPVGNIKCTYYDFEFGKTQETIIEIGTGTSIYDLSSNYYLNNIFLTSDDLIPGGEGVIDVIKNILNDNFVPALADISFTPVELSSMGLPYLEAGDYLEIDDADGGTVGTYILNRTLNGIQALKDSIESNGGEVLGDGS